MAARTEGGHTCPAAGEERAAMLRAFLEYLFFAGPGSQGLQLVRAAWRRCVGILGVWSIA
jgi:hypothetical protein